MPANDPSGPVRVEVKHNPSLGICPAEEKPGEMGPKPAGDFFHQVNYINGP
jgi:hypothetical protein